MFPSNPHILIRPTQRTRLANSQKSMFTDQLTADVGPRRPSSASSKGLTKLLVHLPTDRRQSKFENLGLNPLEPLAELFSRCLISFHG